MAVEKEGSDWLPEPPPARPTARDAAIEAAMRKFDGAEEAAPQTERPRRSWASTHRPQVALLVSAMLLVIVGIPAVLIGLRNPPGKLPPPAVAYQEKVPQQSIAPAAPSAPPQPAPPAAKQPAAPPSAPAAPPQPEAKAQVAEVTPSLPVAPVPPVAAAPPPAPSPMIAAAPPPPAPPPPPPPPPPSGRQATAEAMADNLAVTGSRIQQPALEAPAPAKVMSSARSYASFLSKLQAAVRSGNRRAVVALIGFPLRVNYAGGARVYRDASAVERDFDRIFTPDVKHAIASQSAEELFVRDQGAMVGNGQVWFRETCANADCSHLGSVRIVAVNP